MSFLLSEHTLCSDFLLVHTCQIPLPFRPISLSLQIRTGCKYSVFSTLLFFIASFGVHRCGTDWSAIYYLQVASPHPTPSLLNYICQCYCTLLAI